MDQAAFVLRVAPGGVDKVPEALSANQIIIGWAEATGLLDAALSWEQFREIIRKAYYSDEPTLRKAGAAAGHNVALHPRHEARQPCRRSIRG